VKSPTIQSIITTMPSRIITEFRHRAVTCCTATRSLGFGQPPFPGCNRFWAMASTRRFGPQYAIGCIDLQISRPPIVWPLFFFAVAGMLKSGDDLSTCFHPVTVDALRPGSHRLTPNLVGQVCLPPAGGLSAKVPRDVPITFSLKDGPPRISQTFPSPSRSQWLQKEANRISSAAARSGVFAFAHKCNSGVDSFSCCAPPHSYGPEGLLLFVSVAVPA